MSTVEKGKENWTHYAYFIVVLPKQTQNETNL